MFAVIVVFGFALRISFGLAVAVASVVVRLVPTMDSQAGVAVALFTWLAIMIIVTIGASWLWSRRRTGDPASRRSETSPTSRPRSRRVAPRSRAPWTHSANPTPRCSTPLSPASAVHPLAQLSERPRRSRAPSANFTPRPPAAASPPAPDPVRQPDEPPTAVAALAAALESAPRSNPDRRRLVREFREEARAAPALSEPDPPSTPEPAPKPDPVPSPAHADVPPPTADLPPAVERSPRPSASGRLRRHLPWLIQRQGGNCGICRQPLPQPPKGDVVHVDHIVPLVRGGTDQRSNLQATHAACNLTKGSQGARRPPPGHSSPELPPH